MIKVLTGDIFDSEADVLVNPVNCVGVMGKGLALEFKKRFPKNFKHYKAFCRHMGLFPGGIVSYKEAGKIIFNLATKNNWGDKSDLKFIEEGLKCLYSTLATISSIKSVAIPALGCGLGELEWKDVYLLLINWATINYDIDTEIYKPK